MLVGLGGNNGSSVVAGVLANKLCVPAHSVPGPGPIILARDLYECTGGAHVVEVARVERIDA